MMTEPLLETDLFFNYVEKLYREIALEDPLQRMRARAWDQFLELGLPTRRAEVFRYLKMKKLFSQEFFAIKQAEITFEKIQCSIFPECQNSVLVFVNGRFNPDLSNTSGLSQRFVVMSLQEAVKTYGTFLNNQWAKSLKEETDPFAALNAALHPQGAFIYVPPKYQLEDPLQLLFVSNLTDKPSIMHPRVQFFIGKQASLQVVSNHLNLSTNEHFVNQVCDFSLEEGSSVLYTQSSYGLAEKIWCFDATRASLKRDSTFQTVSATEGSATIRSDYRISLTQENSEVLLNGIWMLNEKKEAHTHVLIDHQAPNCRSLQLFKGVLNDFSRSSFEGKILVKQAAQKTQAFQLNHNLLLSDGAQADSKPNLEIFADDVKASHGATVGQLDPEHLFYLTTRGVTKEEAKNILVFGFCQEVIEKIPLLSLKNLISKKMINFVLRSS